MSRIHTTVPFCGLPIAAAGDLPAGTIAAVLGAGSSLGTAHRGSENGPFFVRTMSKGHTWSAAQPRIFDLRHRGDSLKRVVDLGDIDFGDTSLERALKAIEVVVAALPADVAPCVIGGDHSITLPVVEALAAKRADPFLVVQFDHHLDLQIWDSAAARPDVRREPIFNTNVMSHVSDRIGAGRLVQIGVSPYATVEADSIDRMDAFLRSVGRQICLSSPEIDDAELFRAAVGEGQDIYLSVDLDVLQRGDMSSTGYPADVGLSTGRLLALMDLVLERNRLIGFDMVEFAADREDRDAKTLADAGRAVMIFMHALGWVSKQADRPGED